MAITSNAKTRKQQDLLKALVKSLGPKAKGASVQLSFGEAEVNMVFDGHKYLVPTDKFEDWAANGFQLTKTGSPALGRWKTTEGDPVEVTEAAQEAPEEKPAPKGRRTPAKKAEAKPAASRGNAKRKPKPSDENIEAAKAEAKSVTASPKVEEQAARKPKATKPPVGAYSLDEELQALAEEAYEIEAEQQTGEVGSNSARYKLGLLVLKLDQLKARAKEEGRTEWANRKALLELLNKGQLAIADKRDATRKFKPIDEGEATAMSKVAETFLAGDLTARFKLVDTINPVTGEPLVGDDGEPLEVPVTEVAPSKLYPLAKHATSDNFHSLVSFAHNYNESNVKAVVKLSDKLDKPVDEVIDDIARQRRAIMSPITDETIEVGMDDDGLKLWLKEMAPEPPPSPYYSITTERGWAESVWEPLLGVLSAINDMDHFITPNEQTGRVSNVFALERAITQFFNVHEEDGFQRVLGALHQAGDISEARAVEIASMYAFDPETNGLRELTEEELNAVAAEESDDEADAGMAEAEASDAPWDSDEPDESDDEWDEDEPPTDLDIDTPGAEEEDEDEPEGEEEDPEAF